MHDLLRFQVNVRSQRIKSLYTSLAQQKTEDVLNQDRTYQKRSTIMHHFMQISCENEKSKKQNHNQTQTQTQTRREPIWP